MSTYRYLIFLLHNMNFFDTQYESLWKYIAQNMIEYTPWNNKVCNCVWNTHELDEQKSSTQLKLLPELKQLHNFDFMRLLTGGVSAGVSHFAIWKTITHLDFANEKVLELKCQKYHAQRFAFYNSNYNYTAWLCKWKSLITQMCNVSKKLRSNVSVDRCFTIFGTAVTQRPDSTNEKVS